MGVVWQPASLPPSCRCDRLIGVVSEIHAESPLSLGQGGLNLYTLSALTLLSPMPLAIISNKFYPVIQEQNRSQPEAGYRACLFKHNSDNGICTLVPSMQGTTAK